VASVVDGSFRTYTTTRKMALLRAFTKYYNPYFDIIGSRYLTQNQQVE